MKSGALEYVVIGVPDHPFTQVILPELHALQGAGHLRVVDLLVVQNHADGTATTWEVRDLRAADVQRYAGMADDLAGVLTAEDVDDLAATIPAGTAAVIVLFAHTWALDLTDAIRKAGGVWFAGGRVLRPSYSDTFKETEDGGRKTAPAFVLGLPSSVQAVKLARTNY